ncbi:MAG: DUF1036 domain-containing protein [Pseudomonadota bacterium]
MALAHWFPRARAGVAAALASLSALLCGVVGASAQGDNGQPGETGWQLCNATSYIISAAVGRPEATGITVQGWTKLQPGACETALPGPLQPGVHFLYARTSDAHRGGAKHWGGDHALCIDPTGSFQVENPPNCSDFGLEERRFSPVMVERRNRWKTTLTETDRYTLKKAKAAGVQRLLIDAGIYTGRIDGLLQRRTRSAIGAFLTENGLSESTSDTDLIDLLELSAIDRARTVGFSLCNRTDDRIWSAIARRRGDAWESRGWWLLEGGGCARAIDEALVQSDFYVYGELERPDGDIQRLTRAADAFCVARSKFAIAGRDNCEAGLYRTELFAKTRAPLDGRLVFEFFERDFDPPLETGGD